MRHLFEKNYVNKKYPTYFFVKIRGILMTRKNDMLGTVVLLFCSVIWGAAFAMQELAAETLGPSTVLFTRSLISVFFLIMMKEVRVL